MKNIALITGGFSGEAEISYLSADTIFKNIDKEQYNCYLIDIRREGWFYKDSSGKNTEVNKNDFSILENGCTIKFDAVINGLHGTPGEDGKLSGYFDCINLPYTSCNVAAAAITFNKKYTIALAARFGINVADSIAITKNDDHTTEEILQHLTLPVFVKPNCGGSSIGMSKVNNKETLQSAIETAFNEDETVLVEKFIDGREFTIGVYQLRSQIIPLPITEIISKNEFFDFEAKYKGNSEEITPAQISPEMKERIEQEAVKAYRMFDCSGVVRIDFIYDKQEQRPFMLEINTVPGQSAASIIPQQVAAAGMSLKEFYSQLIEECLQ